MPSLTSMRYAMKEDPRQPRFASLFVCAGLALLLTQLPSGAAPPDPAEIDKLIRQLASDDLAVRTDASKKLEAIGEPAAEALRKAAATSDDPDVRLRAFVILRALDRKQSGEVRRFEGHKDIVWSAVFSPDGRRILSGGGGEYKDGQWLPGSDYALRLWDAETGKELRQFTGHT